jgi:hypothetical protein
MFTFKNYQDFKLENLSQLTESQENQLRATIELYFDEEVEDVADWFYPNHEEGLVFCEYYEIVNKKDQKVYEFWNLNSDSGTIFKAGSTEQIGVEMIQFFFDITASGSEEEIATLEKIAEELQKAFTEYTKSIS